jgi:glycosyltransferase involved in cell wall biosynthesis
LRQIAEQQQVTDRVIWRDSIPHHEVPEVLSQFDVLVLPSRTSSTWKEQFGHVLIEAMAMGIPAVGSDSGEIPNVIHRADLVFPEGDAIALAVILQQMVNEPGWREEVARYGFERVQQHYTHDRIAARLIDLWRSLLESPKTVAPLAIELSRTH